MKTPKVPDNEANDELRDASASLNTGYTYYGSNFYAPFFYQNKLKEKAERLCKKYKIRNSILE